MRFIPRLCEICKHYNGEQKCNAFPQGIPDDVFYFGFDHRKEYPGDNGIRFEIRHSCNYCANYIKDNRCLAFRKGIPEEILLGKFDHSKEYPGDKGIRFKPSWILKEVLKSSKELFKYAFSLSPEEREKFLQRIKQGDVQTF